MPPGPAGPLPEASPEGPRPFPPTRNVVAVALGGAVGGSLRYALDVAYPSDPGTFPWAVFLENVVGAFLLGLLLTMLLTRWRARCDLRPFLTTGVLGSFTTFSTFSLDVVALVGQGRAGVALAYSAASLGAGLVACYAGVVLGRWAARGRMP